MRCVLAMGPQGDIDLLEFMSWVQHMAATPTGVTPNMVASPCNIGFTLTIYQMEPTLNSRSLFLHIYNRHVYSSYHIHFIIGAGVVLQRAGGPREQCCDLELSGVPP
jgi:hypothetical protein